MRTPWSALLLPALAATALALAACGGGDDDDSTGGAPTGDATATATRPAEVGSTPGSAPSPTQAGGSGGSASDDLPEELQRLADQAARLKYTAVYAMEFEGEKTELTIAQDPPRSYTAANIAGSDLILINDGTATITCFKTGTTGFCSKTGTGQDELFDPSTIYEEIDTRTDYKKLDSRRIAGIDSNCWETTVANLGKSVTCFGKNEPVLTLVEGPGVKMELKEYAKSVDAKLFEPPFPVQ